MENLEKSQKRSWKVMEFQKLKRVRTLCSLISQTSFLVDNSKVVPKTICKRLISVASLMALLPKDWPLVVREFFLF